MSSFTSTEFLKIMLTVFTIFIHFASSVFNTYFLTLFYKCGVPDWLQYVQTYWLQYLFKKDRDSGRPDLTSRLQQTNRNDLYRRVVQLSLGHLLCFEQRMCVGRCIIGRLYGVLYCRQRLTLFFQRRKEITSALLFGGY